MLQAIRGAVLPGFDPVKYESIYNTTSMELLNVAADPVPVDVISKMCEKMLNVRINCSFERYKKVSEKTERALVDFLLQISIDVRNYIKTRADSESLILPSGYADVNQYLDPSLRFVQDIDQCNVYSFWNN